MIFNLFKLFLVKIMHRNVVLYKYVKILGGLPIFKVPKNGKVIFGDGVVINSDFKNTNTALTFRCKFVTGYDGIIDIDAGTMINGACIVSYSKVKIGKFCQIASSTIISDTDFHPVNPVIRRRQVQGKDFPFSSVAKKEIIVGDNVWIGWNCTILKGVSIGDDSIVAAGSVVTSGCYPACSLIAGSPAKIIKSYNKE